MMWRLTWQLTTTGVPIEFRSEVNLEELIERMHARSVWRVVRKRSENNKVAFRVKQNHFVAFVVRASIWILARPVFYAKLDTVESKPSISGRFLFQKIVRVEFWLLATIASIFQGIWTYRFINQVMAGLPWDQLIGFAGMLAPGVLVTFCAFATLNMFAKHNAKDIGYLMDTFKTIAT